MIKKILFATLAFFTLILSCSTSSAKASPTQDNSVVTSAISKATAAITDGYYYIICSDNRFPRPMAMCCATALNLRWGELNERDPQYVFYIKQMPSGNYAIKSFYSSAYIGAVGNSFSAIPLSDSLSEEQVIQSRPDGTYTIRTSSYKITYHFRDHLMGTGTGGSVIAWQDDAKNFGLFTFRRIDSTNLIDSLKSVRDERLSNLNSSSIGVVFIGNSITYGATLSKPSVQAPPVLVENILSRKTGATVAAVNCGLSGSTTVDWLPGSALFSSAIDAAKSLRRLGKLYFSLMLGTNDSAERGPNGSPVNTMSYGLNLTRIINRLLLEFPNAHILVNYPIWYSPNTHNGALYKQPGLDRLQSYFPVIDKVVQQFQSENKNVYAGNKEAYTFFENKSSLFTPENGNSGIFYLHPNLDGANKLAEYWADGLLSIIEQE